MQRRPRYFTIICLLLMSFIALYRKYSAVLVIERDPPALTIAAEDPVPGRDASAQKAEISVPAEAPVDPVHRRANATFVMLARNSDLEGVLSSVRQLEERFNQRFGYPYVFLNEEEFSEEFKRKVQAQSLARVEFGIIPREHWYQPDWIDNGKAQVAMQKMQRMNVKYGGSIAYHNMCRFNSGFFFKHPLMLQYRWYWRVEPSVKFHCDINQDPFRFMEDNDKVYGFTLAVYEIPATVPSLWGHVKDFMAKYPEYIRKEDNALRFISNNGGHTYNRCHFWSNFEIASLEFWRSPAYTAFFEHLDATGGFYYERWGDAPVHSIAVALLLPKSKIHLFEEIGYQHDDWSHCPQDEAVREAGKCACSVRDSFDYTGDSCRPKWDAMGHA
ncbi:alpha-1,2-mannosyltransferase [Mycena vitilis]|nr:alpha-1,2-mannosyltransferase [Mycena vitilis]